tara:strand:- start:442 stop:663 length:222 start_codon:yes stop_codon:yes gene_type:complete
MKQQTNSKLQKLIKDYKICFGSEEGKRILEDLSKRCGDHVTTHCKGDSHESAFLEGNRSVFIFIKNMINKKEE